MKINDMRISKPESVYIFATIVIYLGPPIQYIMRVSIVLNKKERLALASGASSIGQLAV